MSDDLSVIQVQQENSFAPGLALAKRLMALATPERVPSGILHRCTSFSTPIRDLDGSERAPACHQRDWENVYHDLFISYLRGPKQPATAEVKELAARFHAKGLTPLFLADFQYEIIRPRFWLEVDRHLKAGLPAESFPFDQMQLSDVLESREAFFGAALLKTEFDVIVPLPQVHRGLEVSFIVPREGYFTNAATTLLSVEADFNQGKGYQAVPLDTPITVRYAEPGRKTIKLRCTTSEGVRYARAEMEVAETVAPPWDDHWKDLTAFKPFGDITAKGQAWVYRGFVNGRKKPAITDPVIISEGFPGNYSLDTLWERLSQQNFANNLLQKGYDLIILGLKDGTLPIQANAYLAISCIQTAISKRTGSNKLVVGGASMGGLITRYALVYMAKNNMDHQTVRYFSIDTPHEGATIPVAIQSFLQYMSKAREAAREKAELLRTPAAQQMLLQWVPAFPWQPGVSWGPSPERGNFIRDLHAQGWMPSGILSAGVADGVGSGVENGDTPGAKAVWYEISACFWDDLFVFPRGGGQQNIAVMCCDKVDNKIWTVSVTNGSGYDSAPGGLKNGFKELYDALPSPGRKWLWFPNACFVPTVSACAVATGNLYLPFSQVTPEMSALNHYKYSSASNLTHTDLSKELADYLVNFISGQAVASSGAEGESSPELPASEARSVGTGE